MVVHYPLSEESIERLNHQFFSTYDTDHWFYKIKMNELLLENTEEFFEEIGDDELRDEPVESFHRAVQSEIVFTFYHISESLFMLIAVCDSVLPWVEMKHIRVKQIADFMRETVIDEDWDDGELERIFYPGVKVPEEHEGKVEASLDFIEEYLSRMSHRYLDNDIYNEYKHGLRLSTSKAGIKMAPEKEVGGETGPVALERGGTSHIYLEDEEVHREDSEVYYKLKHVMSGFDYQLFMNLCGMNYQLIDQIIRMRQGRYGPNGDEREEIRINTYHDTDIDEVFDYDPGKEWAFRHSYPVGDAEVKIG